jgi:hypothetical protein
MNRTWNLRDDPANYDDEGNYVEGDGTAENKVPTRTVEVEGVKIEIPVGSMDEPTQEVKDLIQQIQDSTNWKLPVRAFKTRSVELAQDVAYGLDWYMGGHEMEVRDDGWIIVTSKGYYHYIGA